jgi:hypothetical protein
MIRYYDKSHGVTRISITKFHHVDRLGKLTYIKGHFYKGKYGNEANVVVRGVNGTCTFSGLSWGYGGEGPHGLLQLLLKCHVPIQDATSIAFRSNWNDDAPHIEWVYRF